MRRRSPAGLDLPAVPPGLRRFSLPRWWDPAGDEAPERWVPASTAEERFEYHAVRAVERWTTARHGWEQHYGVRLADVPEPEPERDVFGNRRPDLSDSIDESGVPRNG